MNKKISNTLRELRSQRGWSLEAASQRTGVSKAMLGQIERGESSPTIATLWKIASGFEVSFSLFIEEKPQPQVKPIHRRLTAQQLHAEDNLIRIMPIFPYDEQIDFEVFIIELLPGCTHLSPPHQKGVVEHVIVTKGAIEVLANDEWHTVATHEGLRFNADAPHGYRNHSSKNAVFVDMIHYNR